MPVLGLGTWRMGESARRRADELEALKFGLELGYPMVYDSPFGIAGPKGMDPKIVAKLHDAFKKALEDPAVRKRIEETGSLVVANSPGEFAAQIKAEFDVYKKVVETQHLKLD